MSLSYFDRFRKRNVITIIILSVGLVSLSCINVINGSFDVDKYMVEVAVSDFTISEKTLMNAWGNYDPEGNTISEDVLQLVNEIEGVREKGVLYSQDELIKVSDSAYKNITEYYEQDKGKIIEYMGKNFLWNAGYRKLKSTYECKASVFGMEEMSVIKFLQARYWMEQLIKRNLLGVIIRLPMVLGVIIVKADGSLPTMLERQLT